MKIIETNTDQLEINENGIMGVILGAIFVIVGVIVIALPLFSASDWWWSLIGLLIAGFGALFAYNSTSRSVILRRNGGTSQVTETRIITKKSQTRTFTQNQITAVTLESSTHYERNISSNNDGSNETRRVRQSVLYVTLTDNSQIILATKSQSGGMNVAGISLSSFGKPPLSKEGNQVAAFFNLPLVTQDTSSSNNILDTFTSVKNTITAVNQPTQPTTAAPSQSAVEQSAVSTPSVQPGTELQPTATAPLQPTSQSQPQALPTTPASAQEAPQPTQNIQPPQPPIQ